MKLLEQSIEIAEKLIRVSIGEMEHYILNTLYALCRLGVCSLRSNLLFECRWLGFLVPSTV